MKNKLNLRPLRNTCAALATGLLALAANSAFAATWIWNASPADNVFSNASNWTPAGFVSAVSTDAEFNTSSTTAINLTGNFVVGRITFNSGASAFTISGANNLTLAASITNNSTFSQSLANNINFGSAASTKTFNTASGDIAVSGNIIGGNVGGQLLKTGSGTLTLSGTGNTYVSPTNISVGTLLVNNASGSGTGTTAVSVSSGATLGGTGIIAPTGTNGISVGSGGFLAPGAGGIGTLTVNLGSTTGTVAMVGGSSFKFELGTANATIGTIAAGSSDMLALTGASGSDFAFNTNNIDFLGTGTGNGFYKLFDTSLNATTWTGLTFNITTGLVSAGLTASNFTGGTSANFFVGTTSNGGNVGDIYLNVIPEPTYVMLLGGLGILLMFRRRQSLRNLLRKMWGFVRFA